MRMSKKQISARIQAAYIAVAEGVGIPMLELPKIWKAGEDAIASGADDEALRAVIKAAVDKAVATL
jgi:hypothetical protein